MATVSLKKTERQVLSPDERKKARAVGADLRGADLDRRLERARSGKEEAIPASAAVEKVRRRYRP
jgi:hypothetical protein